MYFRTAEDASTEVQRMQALKLYGMNPELIAERVDELGTDDVEYVRGEGAEIR
jgi:hypothetical protein